ncbi:hypothetical protein HML84_08905 [Alcanivorax sp. IO_7]|nr:hypothetical protein HML84_08905 [Alcanivorax sp. IO_7]
MTGKDDSNNPPNVAPWPVMSTVLLALAGAVGGAAILAVPGLMLGAMIGSWTVSAVLAGCSPPSAPWPGSRWCWWP